MQRNSYVTPAVSSLSVNTLSEKTLRHIQLNAFRPGRERQRWACSYCHRQPSFNSVPPRLHKYSWKAFALFITWPDWVNITLAYLENTNNSLTQIFTAYQFSLWITQKKPLHCFWLLYCIPLFTYLLAFYCPYWFCGCWSKLMYACTRAFSVHVCTSAKKVKESQLTPSCPFRHRTVELTGNTDRVQCGEILKTSPLASHEAEQG